MAAEEAALAREEALLAAEEAAAAAAEAERRAVEAARKRASLGLNRRPVASSRPLSPAVQSGCYCRGSSVAPTSPTPWHSPAAPRRSPRPPHAFYDFHDTSGSGSAAEHDSASFRKRQQQEVVSPSSGCGQQKKPWMPLSLLPRGGLESPQPRKHRVSSEILPDNVDGDSNLHTDRGYGRGNGHLTSSSQDELGVSQATLRTASRMIATELVSNAAAQAAAQAKATEAAQVAGGGTVTRARRVAAFVCARCCTRPRLLVRHILLITTVCAVGGALFQHTHLRMPAEDAPVQPHGALLAEDSSLFIKESSTIGADA